MRFSRIAPVALLATTMFASPALAQDEEAEAEESGPIEISGNVALTTDYRFRGVSFSGEDIAIQGGFDVAHESGFYVGAWASSLEDSALYGNSELDIYAGWSGDVATGLSIDAGVLYYIYPNGNDLVGDSDYFEPYASAFRIPRSASRRIWAIRTAAWTTGRAAISTGRWGRACLTTSSPSELPMSIPTCPTLRARMGPWCSLWPRRSDRFDLNTQTTLQGACAGPCAPLVL